MIDEEQAWDLVAWRTGIERRVRRIRYIAFALGFVTGGLAVYLWGIS